jgi:hypothetical protein
VSETAYTFTATTKDSQLHKQSLLKLQQTKNNSINTTTTTTTTKQTPKTNPNKKQNSKHKHPENLSTQNTHNNNQKEK